MKRLLFLVLWLSQGSRKPVEDKSLRMLDSNRKCAVSISLTADQERFVQRKLQVFSHQSETWCDCRLR